MFKRLVEPQSTATFEFEGQAVEAVAGESLAAALLNAGQLSFRCSGEDGSLRGPYCMIGNCFECLVWLEGQGSRQACREPAREGLKVRRHSGLPDPKEFASLGDEEPA